ncbi:hypothetical protein [Hymenobacter volaticus]|uniref:Uncharacterized protein n=1 Tax=Hymenobacter volaticus TaxID=2932254 RepID=A0ABY4GE92_9BACT|nr:hypothetical protein [Hymenobacter volaticus]UOQ69110.1 hypothetical protein MUN86_25665 [Hymenobacter volaticus]
MKVYFPTGTYRSYFIRLQSRISLFLDQGATLLAATPVGKIGYDVPEPGAGNRFQDFGHSHWRKSLIWGENRTDISILGFGTIYIYGQGLTREGPHRAPVSKKAIALKLCRNSILEWTRQLLRPRRIVLTSSLNQAARQQHLSWLE